MPFYRHSANVRRSLQYAESLMARAKAAKIWRIPLLNND